uniref:Lysosomal-associated transmembrane protein 4B n=1 Tax=Plectus sambesii TaxID=2011161 RepID=A0A914X966_9BILA
MGNTDATIMDREKGTAFNENSPRYMCCCSSIHVKTGTLIIAVLAVIVLVMDFVTVVAAWGSNTTDLPYSIGSLVIFGAAIACVFYALRAQRAAFLLPYMTLLVLGICFSAGVIILCIFALGGAEFPQPILRQLLEDDDTTSSDVKMTPSILMVSYAIFISFSLWFLWVVYKCFVFFRDQANFAINNTTSVGYTVNVTPVTYKRQS